MTKLFDAFDAVSAKAWKQKIQIDLKGKDYNDALIWNSLEEISVKPFYHKEDKNTVFKTDANSSRWKIHQFIFIDEEASAVSKINKMLLGGIQSFSLKFAHNHIDFTAILNAVSLKQNFIHIEFDFFDTGYIKKMVDFLISKHFHFRIGVDILGNLAKTGNWYTSNAEDHKNFLALLEYNKHITPTIDTGLYQNSGANMVQQLAYGLAHANEYLNFIDQRTSLKGFHFTFKVRVGSNYFFEIAKLKAFRVLWNSLLEVYEVQPKMHLISTPSIRNKTLYDYNVNMLRTTTECMSAILGGADYIANLPYDYIYHKENNFADRIARNQLLILKNESNLGKVSNPTEGSYYIENLTGQLAEKALLLFKDIESKGGFMAQLFSSKIQDAIKENSKKEKKLFEDNIEVLVGTNKYREHTDVMRNNLERNPFAKKNTNNTLIKPIQEERLAENLEQKRLENE